MGGGFEGFPVASERTGRSFEGEPGTGFLFGAVMVD